MEEIIRYYEVDEALLWSSGYAPTPSQKYILLRWRLCSLFRLLLVTKQRITSHIRDRILAAFPNIALPYMQEKQCLFSYVLCWTQGIVHRSAYIKNNTIPNIGLCHTTGCVLIPNTDICPLVSSYPKLWGSLIVVTSCGVTRYPEKLSLTGMGFDPVSYFICLELKISPVNDNILFFCSVCTVVKFFIHFYLIAKVNHNGYLQ